MKETEPKLNGYPVTGIYAGPHTVLAIDYNGHAVMGVQCSEELQDGSAYMVLLDKHMQVTITTVLGSSIRMLNDSDTIPAPVLIADREDYASTRANLEELARKLLSTPPESTDDLRAAAIVLNDLADVIDGQDTGIKPHTYLFRMNAQAARAAGQALHVGSSADVPSAERDADAEHNAEQIIHVDGGTAWTEQDFERQDTDFSHSICRTCGHFLQYDKPTWIPAEGCKQSLKGATCTIDKNTPEPGMVYCIDYAKKETINDIDPDFAEDVL